ncbi:regulator [Candidatus Vallotia tarda]|uniref:Regulatory protein n=1 Tax=Candidatus Vallotiella hemipterorum TaxID=1177213 RepID=A0A916JT44_9BURK|nr:regulator [Candidatus Vallotia tarda]CAG7601629.1 Regulatory protein [Candidatus Vallotia tarda]
MRSIMHAIHSLPRLHLLVHFALPPLANEQYALQNLSKPALDRLIKCATLVERVVWSDFQCSFPHEQWVAHYFGIGYTAATPQLPQKAKKSVDYLTTTDTDAPFAPYLLLADGGEPRDAVWVCVEPVHMQVAQTHLVLSDPNMLQISPHDAAKLLSVARPIIEEFGIEIVAPTPLRWYLSGESLGLLTSASPLRASGHNIGVWLRHETNINHWSRTWIKLQNEVQIAWFKHPVNQAREAQGLLTANSIWPYAQGRITPVMRPFERVLSRASATRGLAIAGAAALGMPPTSFDMLLKQIGSQTAAYDLNSITLVELDQLSIPFLQQDWSGFRTIFSVMERDWFAPALIALKRHTLSELTLTLCGNDIITTLVIRPIEIKKFWRRRPFTSLLL